MRTAHLAPIVALLLAPGATVLAQAEAPAPKAPSTPPAAKPASTAPARPAVLPTKDSLTVIRERGRLVACVAPQAPWALQVDEGQFTGFSVDIAKQLAEDLGVEVAFVPTDFASLIQALAEGECDVVPGGLSPTPERALFAHFSDPVARHGIGVLAAKQAAAAWKVAADLDRPEVTVGAVAGTAELLDARRLLPKASIVEAPNWTALGEGLLNGKIQAAVAADPLPRLGVKIAPDKLVTPLAEPLATRGESLVVRRGDLEFLAYLNTWVYARRYDGWLEARRDQWFDKLDWADAELARP
jgi:polar amino acid transport system substrate-binding protein